MTIVNRLSFDANQLRNFLSTGSILIDGNGPGVKYHNAITGVGYATEAAALQSIYDTMQTIAGAQYSDRLDKLQILFASL